MTTSLASEEFPVTAIPDIPLWGENYVVQFVDPATGIGALLSMGRWVLRQTLWRNMSYLQLPGNRILSSRNYGHGPDPRVPDSGVFRLEIVEPGRKLRYIFDGPMDDCPAADLNTGGYASVANRLVRFDLLFESDLPIWDMHAGLDHGDNTWNPEANFNSPDGHIEQNGYISGTIDYGEGSIVITGAPATRDHSRGIRDFTRYRGHIWANGVFPDGRGFNMFVLKSKGFDGIAAGRAAVMIDGVLHDARLSDASEGWLDRPDQLYDPFRFTIDVAGMGAVAVDAIGIGTPVPLLLTLPADHHWGVPTPRCAPGSTWVNEQKAVWRWDGIEGHGHLERGNAGFSAADPAWIANFAPRG